MTSAKINNFALFLTRKEKNRLLHTQEYKTVLGEAAFIFTALSDENINRLPDSMTCIVAPDITGTKPRQFIADLVNAVENDDDRVYAYSGYRFKDVLGTVNALQKVDAYNRMPFVPRHTVGDSRPEKIDVITNGTFACSAGTLKYAMSKAVSFGRYDVNLSVAFSKTGTEIVCIVPSTDWSDLPKTSKPVEVMVRMADESRYPLFSYNGWHVVTDKRAVSSRACPSDPDSVAVIITTHNRTDTAKTTIESLVSRLKYPKLHWFIADDRSDPGHVKQLVDKFVELGIKDVYVTETNDEHWGLGASLNNALTAAFKLTDVVLTTEDDWYLQYDLDISEFVDTIKNDQTVGVIRLGAANHLSKYMEEYTDSLACVSVEKYKRDRDKTGRLNSLQVAIRHKRLFDRIGFYIENSNPDVVETDMNSRFVNYGLLKILWPKAYCTYDLVCTENPFMHFGESTVGHSFEYIDPCTSLGCTTEVGDTSTPFFGVVIPVYKSCETLKRALTSIKKQTYGGYRVYVCDDESGEPYASENERSVNTILGARGKFIRAGSKVYAGGARDKCLEQAEKDNVEYILFLDADDLYAYNEFFEELRNCIHHNNNPDLVVIPAYFETTETNTLEQVLKCKNIEAYYKQSILCTPWAKCIKAKLCPRFESGLRRANDVLQHMRVLDTVKTIVPFKKIAVTRKKDGETTLHGTAKKKNIQSIGALTGLLKCACQILEEKYEHEYMRWPVARFVKMILTTQVGDVLNAMGTNLQNLIDVGSVKRVHDSDNRLVTVDLGGRLGNIMLSIYTCFWYAKTHGMPEDVVKINENYIRTGLAGDLPEYFKMNMPIFSNVRKHIIPEEQYNKEVQVADVTMLNTPTRSVDSIDALDRVCFPKYVWHYPKTGSDREQFCKLFRVPELEDELRKKYPEYFKNKNVALHVRRTDFQWYANGKYMEDTASIVKKLDAHAGKTVVVFSDDIDWCKNNITSDKCNIIFHESQTPDCMDMVLMSLFDCIESNPYSTFSYCAKLLNKNLPLTRRVGKPA